MFIQSTYYSEVLKRHKSYVAVLPQKINGPVRIIILLHGFGSNELTWSLNVPLVRYAEEYQVAFFCPAGENSFYTNHADGENYGEAIGVEFLNVIKGAFRLNFKRENVQIAGFSMGGYGAVLLGLKYSRLYSRIGAFSPAFVFYKKNREELHYQQVFSKGDYGSENDSVFQYKKLFTGKRRIPPIQFACGVEDPLYKQTRIVIDEIKKINSAAQLALFSQPGFHDFSLWQRDLERFLKTDERELGK